MGLNGVGRWTTPGPASTTASGASEARSEPREISRRGVQVGFVESAVDDCPQGARTSIAAGNVEQGRQRRQVVQQEVIPRPGCFSECLGKTPDRLLAGGWLRSDELLEKGRSDRRETRTEVH